MERCVFNGIRDRVSRLIHACQHGFTTGKSCVTQLIEVLDIIGSHLDSGGQVDTIYLDMSKAFDKVDHHTLAKSCPYTVSAVIFYYGLNLISQTANSELLFRGEYQNTYPSPLASLKGLY